MSNVNVEVIGKLLESLVYLFKFRGHGDSEAMEAEAEAVPVLWSRWKKMGETW